MPRIISPSSALEQPLALAHLDQRFDFLLLFLLALLVGQRGAVAHSLQQALQGLGDRIEQEMGQPQHYRGGAQDLARIPQSDRSRNQRLGHQHARKRTAHDACERGPGQAGPPRREDQQQDRAEQAELPQHRCRQTVGPTRALHSGEKL